MRSPTLWRVAENISEALDVPRLVVVNFPTTQLANTWLTPLVSVITKVLIIDEGQTEIIELLVQTSEQSPLDLISSELGGCENIEELIELYSQGYFWVFKCEEKSLSKEWMQFFVSLVTIFRQADTSNYFPKMILANCASAAIPRELQNNPSVLELQLWNPVNWEEMRIHAAQRVADEPNEIRKAWMVCTYSGAANFDPILLSQLVDSRPKSLDDVIQKVMESVIANEPYREVNVSVPQDNFGNEWRVPPSQEEAWKKGEVFAAFIDRGIVSPWSTQQTEGLRDTIMHIIWREQVTGLFALLIEIGKRTNEKLFEQKGDHWIDTLTIAIEPGKILDAYHKSNLGWMPSNIFRLLKKLKSARNQLAHLEPVERVLLEEIWDLDLRIRRGQY